MRETSLRTRPVSLALETAPHDTPLIAHLLSRATRVRIGK